MRGSTGAALAVAASILYAASCWAAAGGLATDRDWGDVGTYERYGRNVLDGEAPYRDFSVEYPPLAFAVFVGPALATVDERHPGGEASKGYLRAFKLQMAALGLAALLVSAWLLARLERSRREAAFALASIAVAPVLLGHVFLNRYDAWPSLLAVATLAVLLLGRARWTGVLLAAGFAAKIFALAPAPVAGVRFARVHGRRAVVAAALAFVIVAVVVLGTFAALDPGALAFSFSTQARRGLHVESIGASLLLAADELGLYDATVAFRDPGAFELVGRLPDAVALASTGAQLLALATVYVLYARGAASSERTVTGFTAAIAAAAVLGKVLSPQFLIWLVPLVPLVGGRHGRAATVTFAAALALTQVELNEKLSSYGVWSLVARNAALVCVVALLVDALRARNTRVT